MIKKWFAEKKAVASPGEEFLVLPGLNCGGSSGNVSDASSSFEARQFGERGFGILLGLFCDVFMNTISLVSIDIYFNTYIYICVYHNGSSVEKRYA